jgi:hypothetical protein
MGVCDALPAILSYGKGPGTSPPACRQIRDGVKKHAETTEEFVPELCVRFPRDRDERLLSSPPGRR